MDQIANFNLFGELADLPDVVHCETIEVRSALHDWELTPHRHGRLHQFLMLHRGHARGRFDDVEVDLSDNTVVNVPTGCVHSYSFEPGTQGWVVTVASEVLDEWLAEGEGLRPVLSRPAQVPGNMDIRDTITTIFDEFETRDFGRAHVLRARIALLAGLVARAIADQAPAAASPDTTLQRRFEALVEAHFVEHLGVADYAGQLAVTPTHLSRVMRAATGRPASGVIQDRVIREARRNLAYSNLSVSEVAYALGYQDPSHFSRVFSRATGLSPRAFRQQIEARTGG
ncbi:helix-turn-helix domain-containing protein [Maritimibacter sp. UBA3975]|uniref:helix-turn-helix domain-containing protein n=1 Tax=Maritimibacter sp. UBA3975 TaxID=1946833 RepID=UPI000C0B196E|nr:helix-turn-helix domain-containing protein [Maritimibacter sp. UBA3975]MAM60696.1 AraC family transcriptional regulator [Maritimibacter sp.]